MKTIKNNQTRQAKSFGQKTSLSNIIVSVNFLILLNNLTTEVCYVIQAHVIFQHWKDKMVENFKCILENV